MVTIDNDDLGKTRFQVLMDLIYESNGFRFPLDKITFKAPSELDKRKDLEFDPNTFIPARVNPRYDARFATPQSGIMYRRRSLPKHIEGINFKVITPMFLPFKISDVLDQINEIVPYEFQIEEIVDYEYKTLDEARAGIRLQARPESVLWFAGKSFMINTKAIGGGVLIENPELDGFHEYVA